MIRLNEITKITNRFYIKKVVAFISSERFCYEHMKEFIKKRIAKKDYKKFDVVRVLGMCSRCKKLGIVYYLEEK